MLLPAFVCTAFNFVASNYPHFMLLIYRQHHNPAQNQQKKQNSQQECLCVCAAFLLLTEILSLERKTAKKKTNGWKDRLRSNVNLAIWTFFFLDVVTMRTVSLDVHC